MQVEKGKLVRWIEEKGFGFIKPETGGSEIFIHISALRGMSRNPVVGDIIFYQTGFGQVGKVRAIDASIEGVAKQFTLEPMAKKPQRSVRAPTPYKTYTHSRSRVEKSGNRLSSLAVLLVAAGGFFVYDRYSPRNTGVENNPPIVQRTIPKPTDHAPIVQRSISKPTDHAPIVQRLIPKPPVNAAILEKANPKQPDFQCQGKIYCSQMGSIEEAEFYLQNCPGTKLDGDNDGIPCERQFYGAGQ